MPIRYNSAVHYGLGKKFPSALPILRAGKQLGTFLSVFGRVSETRLTAVLGYLISRFPAEFSPLFMPSGRIPETILVEENVETGRFDVSLTCNGSRVVIEAKTGYQQSHNQIRRYAKELGGKGAVVTLDRGGFFRHSKKSLVKKASWDEIARICERVNRSAKGRDDPLGAALAHDLAVFLEEQGMTLSNAKEFYTRDLSEQWSVELLFRHRVYISQTKFYRLASNSLYYAPCFTKGASKKLLEMSVAPIGEGISFVASIRSCQIVQRKGIREHLRDNNVPNWRGAMEIIRSRNRREHMILVMDQPKLLFHPPILKRQLGVKGMMGSQCFTLNQLLEARDGTRRVYA